MLMERFQKFNISNLKYKSKGNGEIGGGKRQ